MDKSRNLSETRQSSSLRNLSRKKHILSIIGQKEV